MASVRERKSPAGITTYAVLYRHGTRQTSKTFEAKKKAEKFKTLIDLLGVDKALATLKAQTDDGLTVDALFEKWIDWKASTKVTARTLRDYRRDYDNAIRRPLGHRHAESVDELDVQAWVDKIAKTLDPKTVGDRHMILGSMYRYGSARSRQLVKHNPCLETQLPSKRKKKAKGFTLVEWGAMHEWGAKHERDADDLLLFLASTGWRFSEATPLSPAAVEDMGDLELEDGTELPLMSVSVLGVHRMDENDRRVYVEGEGKSEAAMRRINLPPEAAQMVRRRMTGKKPGDLLFTNAHGSQWRSANFLDREFQRILDGAGITKVKGMGPHYLRHTHVAMLDRAGVSLAKTQRRIGHENISTTLGVYGGMIDNTLSPEELTRLGALITKPTKALGVDVVTGQVVASAVPAIQSSSSG